MAIQKQVATIAIKNFTAYSYIYEKLNKSAVSDGEFDELCKWMLENYDWISTHDLNQYITKECLQAGTGMRAANRIAGQTLQYALELAKNV